MRGSTTLLGAIHTARLLVLCSAALLLMAIFAVAVPVLAGSPESTWPPVPADPQAMGEPLKAEIYEHDDSPLGDRIPLVILHGGGAEVRRFFRMDRIAHSLSRNQEIAKKFKVFYLRYNASTLLDESVPQIQAALKEFYRQTSRPMVTIGYSLGGNAMQRALLDPEVNSAVVLVVSLGAPLRGSPLFCNDWYEYSLHKNHWHFWSGMFRTLSRRFYFAKRVHLLHDLRWDNADGHVPEVGVFRSDLPYGPRGNLTVDGTSNEKLAAINNEGPLTKTKFITYAAYLRNPYMFRNPLRQIVLVLETPIELVITQIPILFGEEHAALSILNRDLGRVHVRPEGPSSSDKPGTNATAMPYLLNDGLAPVTSCILLSPEAFRAFPAPRKSDLPKLNEWLDVRLARVFCSVDHISFADGKPPWVFCSNRVKDEMHPKEHRHTLYDWLARDLLDFAATLR